jgi:NADH:ubiquinone reductase (H+-translocating)
LLRRRGVDVRRRTPVVEVTPKGVTLERRAKIDGLVVWATGWAAEGSALLPGADTVDGRLVVDQTLRVPGTYGVFAAGDVAAHRDLFGQPLAMSAQIAVRAGAVAGRNAARYVKGLPGSPALLVDIGRLVTLGRRIGVGTVGPIPLAAPVLDRFVPLLHDLVDAQYILKTGGLSGLLAHGQGRHRPRRAEMRRAERPEIRSVS